MDTVLALATALAGLGANGATAQQDAFAAIAPAITNLGTGVTLDLSNPANISALLTSVAQHEGIDVSLFISAVSTAIASCNAAIGQKLTSDGASDTLLTDVSAVEKVTQGNQSPHAVDDSNGVTKGGTIVGNVLGNDSDPDGDMIQLTGVVGGTLGHSIAGTYGTLTLNSNGTYSYVANKGGLPSQIVPEDTFTYGVTDGHGGTGSANLSIVVLNPSQKYQAGTNTTLIGGNGKNVLDGTAGHDILLGGNGPDVLIGGPGDKLTGGNGPDIFLFNQHFGLNTITDFNVNNDAIQLSKALVKSVTDVLNHTTDSAAGAIIAASATDQITLLGVTKAQLMTHPGDFYLA
jgi:VCBS repeat-containing protein